MEQIPTSLSALQQAGVAESEFRSANLWLREMRDVSLLRIRSLQPERWIGAMRAAGVEAPENTGQSSGCDPVLMCLRPGEWLVLSETIGSAGLHEKFQAMNPGQSGAGHSHILQTSDGLAVFRLSGAAAPWLLAKLGGLDFLGASASGQHCARTRMGQLAVVVNYRPANDGSTEFGYDLVLDRSVAHYFWDLLLLSAAHAEELLATA